MCINRESKFEMFENAVVMIFMAGIDIPLPLRLLALVQESSKEKENERSIKDLEDRVRDLE